MDRGYFPAMDTETDKVVHNNMVDRKYKVGTGMSYMDMDNSMGMYTDHYIPVVQGDSHNSGGFSCYRHTPGTG